MCIFATLVCSMYLMVINNSSIFTYGLLHKFYAFLSYCSKLYLYKFMKVMKKELMCFTDRRVLSLCYNKQDHFSMYSSQFSCVMNSWWSASKDSICVNAPRSSSSFCAKQVVCSCTLVLSLLSMNNVFGIGHSVSQGDRSSCSFISIITSFTEKPDKLSWPACSTCKSKGGVSKVTSGETNI